MVSHTLIGIIYINPTKNRGATLPVVCSYIIKDSSADLILYIMYALYNVKRIMLYQDNEFYISILVL